MLEQLQSLLQLVGQTPPWILYVLIGAGTAVENVFPPIPSDTFVLLGAVLSEEAFLEYPIVFLVAWVGNVATALGVYGAARRYGRAIFRTRWGHRLLRPHQLQTLSDFYERYGTGTVFGSRFVPVFRVLVPAFAGISGLNFWRTAIPLAVASAIWYAVLLGAGGMAARNLPRLADWAGHANWTLWALAGVVAFLVGSWWWRTRHRSREPDDGEEGGAPGDEPREEAP